MLAILLTLSRLTLVHLPTVGQVIECVNRRCQVVNLMRQMVESMVEVERDILKAIFNFIFTITIY